MESIVTYKVTNANLFNSVDDVELNLKSYERHFQGDVSIEVNGERKTISGQHGANDYADDYGFEIVKEYVTTDNGLANRLIMKFDRNIYNIILVHVARTWERLRLEQPHQEMPLDNIESAEELPIVADFILDTDLVQEFLTNRDGDVWNKFGDGCSDIYIERIATEYITENYL